MSIVKRINERFAAWVRLTSVKVRRMIVFFSKDIWELNPDELSRVKKRLVNYYKVIVVMLRGFSVQKIGFQGKALSYLCTMAIVPSLAIAFWLTRSLNLSDLLYQFLITNLKDPHMIGMLMNSADNILHTAQSGLFGLVSAAAFVWMVIWMMMCVERVFNSVWMVSKPRSIWRQASAIFAILLASPFVIIMFFSGSVVYSHILDLVVPSKIAFSESIKTFLGWVVFYAVSVLTISFMFKYIPNTKVHYRNALVAALWTGLAFTVVQYLYLETQVFVTRQSAIYGVLAAIPMFMIWLNMGWTIILYGAELSFGFQAVETYDITNENMDEILDELKHSKRYDDTAAFMKDVRKQNEKEKAL